MKTPGENELRELQLKCWMTHDGTWFYHCLQECGIDKTNEINRAASRSLAMVEVKRVQKAYGLEKIETFDDLQNLVRAMFDAVKGDFMKFDISFPSKNILHFDMRQCFAYDGMKKMGVLDRYQCGIYHRVRSWFDALKIEYSVSPPVEGCMLHTQGECFRDFKFNF